MIRFLQNSFILASILLSTSSLVIAQNEFQENTDSRTPQEILDSYGGLKHAVLHMTRPEWEVVREWDGFDQTAYVEALKEFKSSFDGERAKRKEQRLKMIQQNDDCGCWVEPDETYMTLVPPGGLGGPGPNEVEWATQGVLVGTLIAHLRQLLSQAGHSNYTEAYTMSFTLTQRE